MTVAYKILPWEEGYSETEERYHDGPPVEPAEGKTLNSNTKTVDPATSSITQVDCYQCKKAEAVGGSTHFPFCSLKCKEEYGATHYQRKEQRYKTVEECQARIKELVRGKKEQRETVRRLF